MNNQLIIQAGQHSHAGSNNYNDDCCGIRIACDEALKHKGIVIAIADGVGSAEAGREASEHCIQGFIGDYYSTPDTWTVKTSGERVINAINSWLYSQGQQRFQSDLGLASTLSVLILKSTTAHIMHVGDTRISRMRQGHIKCLTKDHQIKADNGKSYLARAMGAEHNVRMAYHKASVEQGDIFILTSDGVHGFITERDMMTHINDSIQASDDTDNLENIAHQLCDKAIAAGSDDNVTCQIIRIQQLPNQDDETYFNSLTHLSFPPPLEAGMTLDDYRVIKTIHASNTIQIYLVEDTITGEIVVMKTPSINFDDDPTYIDRFMHEEWVGRRISNPHVLKVFKCQRPRSRLYYITEFIDGQSLTQWRLDNPTPSLDQIRKIATQIIKGLRAFQRKEMVHQDLKPENIMIDQHGVIKIIDFGCVRVSGIQEVYTPIEQQTTQGTVNYIAPELYAGYEGTSKSDQYSLGVLLYELLANGHFPYPKQAESKARKHHRYKSIREYNHAIPLWIDGALKKAVQADPQQRYDTFSELLYDLSHPNPRYIKHDMPLLERHPLSFWRAISLILLITNIILLSLLLSG